LALERSGLIFYQSISTKFPWEILFLFFDDFPRVLALERSGLIFSYESISTKFPREILFLFFDDFPRVLALERSVSSVDLEALV